jgi:hypothetical protein
MCASYHLRHTPLLGRHYHPFQTLRRSWLYLNGSSSKVTGSLCELSAVYWNRWASIYHRLWSRIFIQFVYKLQYVLLHRHLSRLIFLKYSGKVFDFHHSKRSMNLPHLWKSFLILLINCAKLMELIMNLEVDDPKGSEVSGPCKLLRGPLKYFYIFLFFLN